MTTASLHSEADGTTSEKFHRFDQSIINILLCNNWMRDSNMEYVGSEEFFAVKRTVTHMYNITTCNKKSQKNPTDAI